MIDIIGVGTDLELFDTQTEKGKNILSVQLGALEYAPDFGIDLKYFLSEDFKFQNESFKSYLVQVLANNGINVATVLDTVQNLAHEYEFKLTPPESSGSLIAR
jgi:hypothetical protein